MLENIKNKGKITILDATFPPLLQLKVYSSWIENMLEDEARKEKRSC